VRDIAKETNEEAVAVYQERTILKTLQFIEASIK
jgi:hypothetical protein